MEKILLKYVNEKMEDLRKSGDECNPDIAAHALALGQPIELAFKNREITEDEMTALFDEAGKITTRFRHDCSCSIKKD